MYELTEFNLRKPSSPERVSAIIRVSKLPDSCILETLFMLKLKSSEKTPSAFLNAETSGYFTSALHVAIKAKSPVNVSLPYYYLMTHGANPDRIPRMLFQVQRSFFSFSPSPMVKSRIFCCSTEERGSSHASASSDRSTEREGDWCAKKYTRRLLGGAFYAGFRAWPWSDDCSWICCSNWRHWNVWRATYAGVDTAAWKWERPYNSIPSEPSVSYLSISTPLHRAVEANQLVRHLLDVDFAVLAAHGSHSPNPNLRHLHPPFGGCNAISRYLPWKKLVQSIVLHPSEKYGKIYSPMNPTYQPQATIDIASSNNGEIGQGVISLSQIKYSAYEGV